MASILEFEKKIINGEFVKGNSTAFYYPYLYSLTDDCKIYRLNVETMESNFITTIDISNVIEPTSPNDVILFPPVIFGKTYTEKGASYPNTGKKYLYFNLLTRTAQYIKGMSLCGYNVDTQEIDVIYKSFESYNFQFVDTGFLFLTAKMVTSSTTLSYTVYYAVRRQTQPNTPTIQLGTKIHTISYLTGELIRTSDYTITINANDELLYPNGNCIPTIVSISGVTNKTGILMYGGTAINNIPIINVGYSFNTTPVGGFTLNDNYYDSVSIFRLKNQIYIIGGSKNGVPNADVIVLSDDLVSTKIFDIENDTTELPYTYVRSGISYTLLSNNILYVSKTTDYHNNYEFTNNDGQVIASLDDKLPIQSVTLDYNNDTVSVNVTYIDYSDETITYTLDSIPNKVFVGLSTINNVYADIAIGTNNVNIEGSTIFYPVYASNPPSSTFAIDLFSNTAELNRVDKNNFLTNVGSLFGALRNECDIISPVIIFEYPYVPTFNYVHIPIFNRYYYVETINSINKNVWSMVLKCDVLMSYKDEIKNLSAIVGRQEYEHNDYLIDNSLPTQNNPIIDIVDIPSTVFAEPIEGTVQNYVLTVIGNGEDIRE